MAVDAVHEHVFVSGGPGHGSIAVFNYGGTLTTTIGGYSGVQDLEINDGILYAALPNSNAIGRISTTTLTSIGSISVSPFTWPKSLAVAADRLWFGYCGSGWGSGGIASVDLGGATTVTGYTGDSPVDCPDVTSGPTASSEIFAWNDNASLEAIFRLNVSSAPGSLIAKSASGFNIEDVAVVSDGTRLLIADSQSKVVEVGIADLEPTGYFVTLSSYGAAVDTTAAGDGMFVAGCSCSTGAIKTYEYGASTSRLTLGVAPNELYRRGLRFSPNGALLFAVSAVISGTGPTTQKFQIFEAPTEHGSALSLGLSDDGISPGGTVELAGQLTLSDGPNPSSRTIRILRSVNGPWSDIGTATTDGTGHFSLFDTPPLGNYEYKARWDGDTFNRPADSDVGLLTVVGPGNRTVFVADSKPGDFVGHGRQDVITPLNGSVGVSPFGTNGFELGAGGGEVGYTVWVEPPTGQTLAPGTYSVSAGPDATHARLNIRSGFFCGPITGTLVITSINFSSDGTLQTFAGSYAHYCNDGPGMFGEIRYHSSNEYVAAASSPLGQSFGEREVGTASPPKSVTLTNLGTLPILVGQSSFDGDSPQSYAASSNACTNQTLQPGDACQVGIVFQPDAVDYRNATFHITDQTRRGGRDVPLTAFGYLPATIYMPTGLTAPVAVTFTHPVENVTTSNVVLRVNGTTANLPGAVACSSFQQVVSCSSNGVTSVTLKPSSPLVPGQFYRAYVNPDGASPIIFGFEGASAKQVTATNRASTAEPETSVRASYAWRAVANASAYGGSYATEHLAGASAAFAFSGTAVTWYARKGPDQGIAAVYVDGASRGTINLYAASTSWRVPITYSSLGSGAHTIKIFARGLKGSSAATGAFVTIDAIKVGSSLATTPRMTYAWQTIVPSSTTRYVRTDAAGSSAYFTFRGSAISWLTYVGSNMGKASVYVDGTLKGTVDLYSGTSARATKRFYVSDGVHTIRIVVLGQRNIRSAGTYVTVDGWIVS